MIFDYGRSRPTSKLTNLVITTVVSITSRALQRQNRDKLHLILRYWGLSMAHVIAVKAHQQIQARQ